MEKETDKIYNIEEKPERVVLVGIDRDGTGLSCDESLDELEDLAETAGAEVIGRLIQKREDTSRSMYLGSGKTEELKAYCEELEADGIICDDELTPSQTDYLEKHTGFKIMDRTLLILDIFAKHAASAEGKVQVELAQLRYKISHLTGRGKEMSRLGGGIGTRGSGEKKLETDRRRIASRISELNRELKEIEEHRGVIRERRVNSKSPIIALIGYTNAGKSTLMNAITGSEVLCEDKLFATLDATTRRIKPAEDYGSEYLFTDTVGFINKLPHGLIKAFRSTLEEVRYADILIHVVDSSNPACAEQMKVVYNLLDELNVKDKPIITVFNKSDRETTTPLPSDSHADFCINISAKYKQGIDTLLLKTEEIVKSFKTQIKALIPYSKGGLLNNVYKNCEIIETEHRPGGTYVNVYADREYVSKLKKYEETVQ
ncbi:MAG: GTPase HflX [Clostridiales bacterium]|nr:GTPase HflX [Clostridiales bacterium]